MKPSTQFPLGALAALFLLALVTVAAFSAGCVRTQVTLPTATTPGTFTRTSLLSNQSVGKVNVRLEGPDKGVTIDGYGQNGTDLARQALATAQAALGKAP